jgi:hypothetical protein
MWEDLVSRYIKSRRWLDHSDWKRTSALLDDVQRLKRNAPGQGLPRKLFDGVVQWKLMRQAQRTEHHRANITDDLAREITGAAFRYTSTDADVTDRVRVGVLCGLPGIGIGIASSLLAMYFPQEYGVIDFRVWEVIYGERKSTFSIANYELYLAEIRRLAQSLNVRAQLVDFALWDIGGPQGPAP